MILLESHRTAKTDTPKNNSRMIMLCDIDNIAIFSGDIVESIGAGVLEPH